MTRQQVTSSFWLVTKPMSNILAISGSCRPQAPVHNNNEEFPTYVSCSLLYVLSPVIAIKEYQLPIDEEKISARRFQRSGDLMAYAAKHLSAGVVTAPPLLSSDSARDLVNIQHDFLRCTRFYFAARFLDPRVDRIMHITRHCRLCRCCPVTHLPRNNVVCRPTSSRPRC